MPAACCTAALLQLFWDGADEAREIQGTNQRCLPAQVDLAESTMEHNNNQPLQPQLSWPVVLGYAPASALILSSFLPFLPSSLLSPSTHTSGITAGGNKEHMCPSCVPVNSDLQMSWHLARLRFARLHCGFCLCRPFPKQTPSLA
jgi:hypothetical protein